MTFACPKCGEGVDIRTSDCPCGQALSLRAVLDWYWQKLVGATNMRCPACGSANPISAKACDACNEAITVASAVDLVVTPRKRQLFQWAANATPATKKRVQRMYFLLSLAILWWMLVIVEESFPGSWLSHSAIGAVFLCASGLVAAIVVPKKALEVLIRHASATTKLALVANYVCLMLAVRMFTTTWKERAFSLAGIILATGVAAWFLTSFAWPLKQGVASIFEEEEQSKGFDTSGPQGRKARRE